MSRACRVALIAMGLAPIAIGARAAAGAPPGRPGAPARRTGEHRRTIAANERYRVVLVTSFSTHRFTLEVLESPGKVIWKTQPSSSFIQAALDHDRIVIFKKTVRPGVQELDFPGPRRGATMFSLRGETIGELTAPVHNGSFVGPLFLAQRIGGGIIAYELEAAKELWRNDKINVHQASMAGKDLLNVRWFDDASMTYDTHLLSVGSGKVVYQVSGPRDEDVKVLAASQERYLTVRTVTKGAGAPYWKSGLLDRAGRKLAEIRWRGGPLLAAFSPDGGKLAAICASPTKPSGRKQFDYALEVYTHNGKPLQRKKLLTADADVYLEPSIAFDSHVVRAGLARKVNVHIRESSR